MESELSAASRAMGFLWAFIPLICAAVIAAVLEVIRPWRAGARADGLHWLQSVVLVITGNLAARLIIPLTIFSAAIFVEERGIGLFHMIELPYWLMFIIGLMALDFVDYLRHRLFHSFGFLWRAHRLHHSDEQITASTALRFHPFESILTVCGHVLMVLVFGIPAEVVIFFAGLVLFFDFWEHANVKMPDFVRHFEFIFINPDLHRLHHSFAEHHVNSNFGTIFSIWDHMFGSFQPSRGLKADVQFGLGPDNQLEYDTLGDLLVDPVRRG